MNDVTEVVVYSAAAAGFGVAAHRSATALGWPPAAVGLIGTIFLVLRVRL